MILSISYILNIYNSTEYVGKTLKKLVSKFLKEDTNKKLTERFLKFFRMGKIVLDTSRLRPALEKLETRSAKNIENHG